MNMGPSQTIVFMLLIENGEMDLFLSSGTYCAGQDLYRALIKCQKAENKDSRQ